MYEFIGFIIVAIMLSLPYVSLMACWDFVKDGISTFENPHSTLGEKVAITIAGVLVLIPTIILWVLYYASVDSNIMF